jgi:hypothetical protein
MQLYHTLGFDEATVGEEGQGGRVGRVSPRLDSGCTTSMKPVQQVIEELAPDPAGAPVGMDDEVEAVLGQADTPERAEADHLLARPVEGDPPIPLDGRCPALILLRWGDGRVGPGRIDRPDERACRFDLS